MVVNLIGVLLGIIIAIAGLVMIVMNLPGVFIVFIGILISALFNGFNDFPVWLVIVYLVVAILVSFIDNVLVPWGARNFGATKWGIAGSILGGIVGMIVGNIWGILIGPFLGAFLFEFIFAQKEIKSALKAGFGTFLGFIGSVLVKFCVAVFMIILWLFLIVI